ncbi:MAG: YigZ family protein [Bacteroidetes bacterium RIFCSPLOWO2_12_FULL_35_15]|nr:MAG: YigZ family protein [Bacteroidetes bacterium RIFCSPLOWO2_12_FULL_35_15]
MFEDTYLTISKPSEGVFKDKGSKFFAFAFPVTHEEEIKKLLADLRKEHFNARHHCYAFRLGADKQAFRANDDGEPAYTAGKPILGQIQSKDLTNILIVVVRYFGGTLLGVGGLISAYKLAAAAALQNSIIIEKTVNDIYEIKFDYLQMNDVMKIIKDENLEICSQNFELNCSLSFSVRKNNSNKVFEQFSKINDLKIVFTGSC